MLLSETTPRADSNQITRFDLSALKTKQSIFE
jgi:hypothetical protein